MSSTPSPSPNPDPGGVGCRPLLTAFAVFVGFAIAATALGLWLALGDGPPIVQQIGFGLYGAGAPISGLFAALAGDLPLAPFTDVILWLVAAVAAARIAERRRIPLDRVVWTGVGLAAAYGFVISFLIERT